MNPKINILNDYLIDKYEELLPFFNVKLNNNCCLIVYDLYNIENHTVFNNSRELNKRSFKDNYGFIKVIQISLELSKSSKVMLIHNSSLIDNNKNYYTKDNIIAKGYEILLEYSYINKDIDPDLILDNFEIFGENNKINVNIKYDSIYISYILS